MREKTLFYFAAALIPIAVLLLVEVGLRLAGLDEQRNEPFIELGDGGNHLAFNPAYATRYFTTFSPAVSFDPFLKEKSSDVIRIIAMGGSSAAGFPYSYYNSFPKQLGRRLQQHAFDKRVEVINLSMTAVNSYTLWDLKDAVIELDPDAVVIYAGHNEFYGAFGVGSTQFGSGQAIWPKRLLLRLKNLVLFRQMEQLIVGGADSGEGNTPDGRTLMARVVAESGIELDGSTYAAGLRQFEANLRDVLDAFSGASVPVYVGTLASNLRDQPPLGEDPGAIRDFREAQEALARGDLAAAGDLFRQAADKDEIRFRAPSAINQLIQKIASEEGARLVDIASVFTSRSEDGIPGADLFEDHLHPNHLGYRLMADAYYEAMESEERLPTQALKSPLTLYPPLDPIDRATAALQIARLRGGYPFDKEVTFEEERTRFESTISAFRARSPYDSLAVMVATENLAPDAALQRGILLSRAAGDTTSSASMSFGLMYWQPLNFDLVHELAAYTAEDESFDELTWLLAMDAFQLTGQTMPLSLLAAVTLRMRHLEDARFMLDVVERREPDNQSMLFNKARLLVLEGDTSAARKYFERYQAGTGSD